MTSSAVRFAEVIGDPIEHSLSPTIHGFWLQALDIDAVYRSRRVDRSALAGYLSEVGADPAWQGSNVTMPLKLDALSMATDASDRAVAAGAANIILPRNGTLWAGNTDVDAIASLIAGARDKGAAVKTATLLGNGGAARGALVALKLLGIDNVRLQARDLGAAKALAAEFRLPLEPVPLTDPVTTDLLINATPLGMAGANCLNCDVASMPTGAIVFDMVSAPAETSLIIESRARGLRTITGLAMLVEQAATSFKLLFGAEAPRDRDGKLMLLLNS